MTKQPELIDVQVGARVRAYRLARDLSQAAVADFLGVTFQQVQKYEKGVNRISASRLAKLAELFDIPIAHFFDSGELEKKPGTREFMIQLLSEQHAIRLLRAFNNLPHDTRLALVHFVEKLHETDKQDRIPRE